MPNRTAVSVLEFRLYPSQEQRIVLGRWLDKCCWLYNHALAQRKLAYARRKESVWYNNQCKWLVSLRERIESVQRLPLAFGRSALRRIDLAFAAFFRRCKAGDKPGYPRFKSKRRYTSMEYLAVGNYVRGNRIVVPKLRRPVLARGQFEDVAGKQKVLRIIRRGSGWYAQVVVERPVAGRLPPTNKECGIDLGLESFATLDTGETFPNPRLLRKSAEKLIAAQRRVSRCRMGSNRRRKAVRRVALLHERVQRQRRGHAHRVARSVVNRFDRIAIEKLNVKGMAAGMLAKSVNDAGWGRFISILRAKAEGAGRLVVEVNPAGTSMTCPKCGAVKKKKLSERTHRCGCGCSLPRDQAAAIVVRNRAFRPECVEESANTPIGASRADETQRSVADVATDHYSNQNDVNLSTQY